MSSLRGSILLAAVVGSGLASSAQGMAIEAQPVARVELRTDLELSDPERVMALVTIQPGAPLDTRAVRQTLRNLQASGLASEAEVWHRVEGDSLVVSVAFWGAKRVVEVGYEGDLRLPRDDLERVNAQRAGQQLVEGRVLRSVFALQDLYARRGFAAARVRARVDEVAGPYRLRVVYEIEPGLRRKVGALTVEGADDVPQASRTEALALEIGNPFRTDEAIEAAERLTRWLRSEGYSSAEARFAGATAIAGSTRQEVELRFTVELGPRYVIEVEGWSRERLQKAGVLPSSGLEGRDASVLGISEKKIVRYLQGKGFYRARVNARFEAPAETATPAGRRDVIGVAIEIDPGVQYRLVDLTFDGNDSFPDSRLESLMATTEKSRLVLGTGRLVDAQLDDDLEQLRSFYALSGYLWAEVGPAEITETPPEKEGQPIALKVEIPIREGQQARVVDLRFQGVGSDRLAEVRSDLPVEPGGAFHPQRLDEALEMVRARYEGWGYREARVTAAKDPNADGSLYDIDILVEEGYRTAIGRVMVRGNQRLSNRTILGVAGLTPGEPVARHRLFAAQQALYRLGVFSRVEVGLAPIGDDPARRDVIIRLTEGDEQRVSYGLGYDSEEGMRGLFGYSHRNLLRSALHFQLDVRASEESQDFRLLLSRPFWKRGGQAGSQKLYLTSLDEERPSFDVEQRGMELELGWRVRRARYSLFFDWRSSDLALAPEVVLADADLPDGSEGRNLRDIDILSLTPRWVWDGRDDPIDPRRGTLLSSQIEWAVPVDGVATEDFVKVFGQWSHLFPLARAGTLAVSLRGGVIEPLGTQPVSIAERFFAGGSTTHRAYSRDGLGIPGETLDSLGNPIGGNGMFLANVDWRFPVYGDFGGTLFADFGNVWAEARDLRLAESKLGLGIGARFASPVGPVRLDIAWKLDREPTESATEVFFAFGYAF